MATFRGGGDPNTSLQFPSAEALAQAVADAEDAEANAQSSASAAAASASDAAASEANAATSEANAAASYDSFDDRYLGAKASDPALDNDGDALVTGALYFNTTNNEMMVYNGSAWQPYITHTLVMYQYTASADQTAFTGADDNAATLDLSGSVILGVYLNGILLQPTVDYTYTDTTLTLVVGAALNDVLQVSVLDGDVSSGDWLLSASNLSDVGSAATARSNLGLVIGTDVQAFHAYLADIAGATLTKGDLFVFDGTDLVNVGVGTDGQVVTADSAESSGVKWADAAAGGGWTFLEEIDCATGTPSSVTSTTIPAHNEILIVGTLLSHDNGASQRLQITTNATTTYTGGGYNNASTVYDWNTSNAIQSAQHGAGDEREVSIRMRKWDSRDWYTVEGHSIDGGSSNPHQIAGTIKNTAGTFTTLTFDWSGTTNFDGGTIQIFTR